MKDVAARAGVSVRTVSNVVNDFPMVAPGTRARVQEAMRELNYRPNLAARSLRSGRSGMVGLVVPEVHSPYFGELAGLMTDAAAERGWTLLIDQTNGDPVRERRLLEGIRAQVVDGLVFSPWALTLDQIRDRVDDVPLVLLGERAPLGLVDHVLIDNVRAAEEATAHLLALGRRRIAAVGALPHLGHDTAQQRLEGYRRALAAAGLPAEPSLEIPVEAFHRADGAAAMSRLLERDDVPDAVFCFTDQLALGAMRVALQRGLSVPGDLALVGFDDIEDGRYCTPSLTTVSPDKRAIAENALDRLALRMGPDSRCTPPRTTVVAHQLVVRETTAGRPPV